MPARSSVLELDTRQPAGTLRMERRSLHRFLVGYLTGRGMRPSPALRALLIAAIDVYPGPFPARSGDLASHLDRIVRSHLPTRWPDVAGETT